MINTYIPRVYHSDMDLNSIMNPEEPIHQTIMC